MNLGDIQPNLKTIITGIALFAAVQAVIVIDDGLQKTPMEKNLDDTGLAILIMVPQGHSISDSTRGATKIDYTATVWIRTNPKVRQVANPALPIWDPIACEAAILQAAMTYSKNRVHDQGFHLAPGLEPETDWMDVGNNSRLIRFATRVQFNG